ncbi:hypothetical protein MCELHM10_02599 [Paracoccaceae bacterium]|jgi:hypothetical protein
MKLFLANSTESARHAGCKAVMRSLGTAIAQVPGLVIVGIHDHKEKAVDEDAFQEADALLVNGEGTIHHSGNRARFLLDLIQSAKRSGKRVLLVNALFQQYDCPKDDILADLALLTVREPRSAAFARRYGGEPRLLLDSAADPLFLAQGQAIPLAHGRAIGGFHQNGVLSDPFAGIEGDRLTMRSGSFEDIVATLRGAELYLTAQHHGVYAAALAGCPFVASPSNSHKIESFVEWTGLPIPICMTREEIVPAMAFATRNRSMYAELAEFMASQSVLTSSMLAEALG